jgi:hypothetical protein
MKYINDNLFRGRKNVPFLCVCLLILLHYSTCKKYLDAKPDQSIATPSTIADLEGILNSYATINARYPSAAEVSSDDFYLIGTDWSGLLDAQRSYYSWQKYAANVGDYSSPYTGIAYANVLLESLPKINDGDDARKNVVRGNALFVRASYHYALAQLFAKPYNAASAATDLGIALRFTSDISVKSTRSTVAETYHSILEDMGRAISLLPAAPDLKYRASKPAAYGMLARIYLSMSDYKNAGLYADSALSLYNKLIDYNTLSATATIPFKQFNDEVIYDARGYAPQALAAAKARIDTLLYASYAANDLRKTILFKSNTNGSKAFKGNYTGLSNATLFTGVATNELYFIKAEAAVRNGDIAKSLSALNAVMVTRWKKGTYVAYTTTDPVLLLNAVLQERRKDLLFRSLRWTDLRRLNMDPAYMKTLQRNLNGTVYKLSPNSSGYVFQIDQSAVNIGGLVQNP